MDRILQLNQLILVMQYIKLAMRVCVAVLAVYAVFVNQQNLIGGFPFKVPCLKLRCLAGKSTIWVDAFPIEDGDFPWLSYK